MVFSIKKIQKKFWGGARVPLPKPLSQYGGGYTQPLGACGTLTPPILKSWVRTPLLRVAYFSTHFT